MSAETKLYIEHYPDGTTLRLDTVFNALKELSVGRWVITITKYKKKRSIEQNAVLHWYINDIAKETGMNPEIIKEALKMKFLTTTMLDGDGEPLCDKQTGEVLTYVRSTTDLNTVEFMTFLEEIRLWSQEFLNLYLPLPNEDTELKFE
jgi:hypothetical protein